MILSYDANLGWMEFSERTTGICHGLLDSDLDLFGTLIDRAGFRARLVHEYSIFIESLIIYELRAR